MSLALLFARFLMRRWNVVIPDYSSREKKEATRHRKLLKNEVCYELGEEIWVREDGGGGGGGRAQCTTKMIYISSKR